MITTSILYREHTSLPSTVISLTLAASSQWTGIKWREITWQSGTRRYVPLWKCEWILAAAGWLSRGVYLTRLGRYKMTIFVFVRYGSLTVFPVTWHGKRHVVLVMTRRRISSDVEAAVSRWSLTTMVSLHCLKRSVRIESKWLRRRAVQVRARYIWLCWVVYGYPGLCMAM